MKKNKNAIKKTIFIIIFFMLISCELVTGVTLINDTEHNITIKGGRNEWLFFPNETSSFFGYIGPTLQENEYEEATAETIRVNYKDGFYITYLEELYHLKPDVVAKLMFNNAVFSRNYAAYVFSIKMSELISASERISN